MPNNLLFHSDNLAGLQYLLNNGFAGKIRFADALLDEAVENNF
jgi:hypothetical protein